MNPRSRNVLREGRRRYRRAARSLSALLVTILAVPFIVGSDYIWREDIAKGVDRSTYRCSNGLVSRGDLMREVLEKCGEPGRRTQMQLDPNSIWIYRPWNTDRIVYMAFTNEKLQRIHSARCWDGNPHCD